MSGSNNITGKELGKFVRMLCKIEGSDQEIFGRGDVVRLVCVQTLRICLNVDVNELQPGYGTAAAHEQHRDALQELAFVKYATRMCLDCGIEYFEPVRDLYAHNPDPRRVQHILARIVNFLNFREREVGSYVAKWGEQMQRYTGLMERMERLKPENDAGESSLHLACERRAQTEARVEHMQHGLARAEADLQPRMAAHRGLEARFGELRAALAACDAQLGDVRQRACVAAAECGALRALAAEPPEVLREAVSALRRAIDAQRAELAELDTAAHALGARRACLLKLDAALDKCTALLRAMEDARARYKQLKKTSKERAAEHAALADAADKAERRVAQTATSRLPAARDKAAALQRSREARQRQLTADLVREKDARAAVDAEVTGLRREACRLLALADDMLRTAATNRDAHAAHAARAHAAVAAVANQVALYHEELFAAIDAAAALEHCC
jgi:chromosome segregation ATPase